jgi:hypothetical protein
MRPSGLDPFTHYVFTNLSLVSVDVRMPNIPVFNFKHELFHRPLYVCSIREADEKKELVLMASQTPGRVNGIQLSRMTAMPFRQLGPVQGFSVPSESMERGIGTQAERKMFQVNSMIRGTILEKNKY